MTTKKTAYLFAFYGISLLAGSLATYFFANILNYSILICSVATGSLAMFVGHFMNLKKKWAFQLGLLQTSLSLPVFAWLSAITFAQLNFLSENDPVMFQQLAMASLLIIPLTLLTLIVMILQLKRLRQNFAEME